MNMNLRDGGGTSSSRGVGPVFPVQVAAFCNGLPHSNCFCLLATTNEAVIKGRIPHRISILQVQRT